MAFYTPPHLVAVAFLRHAAALVHEYQGPEKHVLRGEPKETTRERHAKAFKATILAEKWKALPPGDRNRVGNLTHS